MPNSNIESQGTEEQEIMSDMEGPDMDSAFDSEGSEDKDREEINYDLSHTLTCLELLNENEELFEGEKGDAFKQMTNEMVKFYKDNQDYFDDIIFKDQKEKREREQVEWNDWNPEELVPSVLQNNEVDDEPYVDEQDEEGEEEPEFMVMEVETVLVESDTERVERQQREEQAMADIIIANDIYRQKIYNQAESNENAADILAQHLESQSQAMFYYQQAAELYLKGALLCQNENVSHHVGFSSGPRPLNHSHRLCDITNALTSGVNPEFQVEVSNFENIGRQPFDSRPLCIRARYLNIFPYNLQEQEPCALFKDCDLEAARDGVKIIAAYCNEIHENLKSTRPMDENLKVDDKDGEDSIFQSMINLLICVFNGN